ncbi:hypothetical protein [Cellulomonas wangleii]|nr:hypothetical protein [Cellulomonas wangleii]
MSAQRLVVALTVAAALMTVGAGTAVADDFDTGVSEDQSAYVLTAREAERLSQQNRAAPSEERLFEYERAPFCREAAGMWVMGMEDGTCATGADLARASVQCEEGDTLVMPMWRRERATTASPWGEWTDIDAGGCGVDLLPVLTAEDFRRLPLPAPPLTLQPDRGWVLVNIETIVYTDPAPVTLRTDLLGYGVTVEATPRSWTYDFGDGHTLRTTSPGRPHPHHDVFHEYEHPGTTAITSTAEWTGRYQVDGSAVWRDVDGTATTTATTAPFTVEERTSRLVGDLCTDRPTPPDC